jgi:hypothetical protein
MSNSQSMSQALPVLNSTASSLPAMQLAGGMKLSKWAKLVGISRTAAWRFRQEGKLAVVVRYGTAYVTAETIRDWFTNDGSKTRAFAKN